MTIYVGNKHWSKPIGIIIYCGRPSILQNRFVIGNDGTRDEVIEKHKNEFNELIKQPGLLREKIIWLYKLARNNDITLMCWCHPAKCHCDTIKDFLEHYLKSENHEQSIK